MEKKRVHTVQEVDELKEWFQENAGRIPASMQIDASAYSKNLKETIGRLFEQAYVCCGNPQMQGCIRLLKQIKKNVEDM